MILEFLVLILPLAAGIAQFFLKNEAVVDLAEDFYEWLSRKSRNIRSGQTILASIGRFMLVPVYSLFMTINDLTANIAELGMRSGIRIASYLYLVVFLFIIVFTFGYKVFILSAIGLGLFMALVLLRRYLGGRRQDAYGAGKRSFVESIWPCFRSESALRRVARLLNVQAVEVDYTGDILAYVDAASVKKKVGTVDNTGKIYDTRHDSAELVGWVDDRGQVIGDRIIFDS